MIALATACSGSDSPPPTSTLSALPTAATITVGPGTVDPGRPVESPTVSSTPAPGTATPAATDSPGTPTLEPAQLEPIGFPIDPSTRLGVIVGEVGSRSIDWTAGIAAEAYSREMQTSDDPDEANGMGWDCRTHVEYEGQPAADWYIPVGTPVRATLDGRATMYVVSLPNAFDYYDASREPYIGNPDRPNAPLSPFPGPGGGKGVFIEVTNDTFVTEYGHLDIESTLSLVPDGAYFGGFSQSYDFETAFGAMRAFNDYTAIASWDVHAGDVIGYSGDSGYSEAPHLHYTVRRAGTSSLLCPTEEAGFEDGGWLFR
jgi:murein DD-endopeptidase MepM/ murein hydrolase activator NlpD